MTDHAIKGQPWWREFGAERVLVVHYDDFHADFDVYNEEGKEWVCGPIALAVRKRDRRAMKRLNRERWKDLGVTYDPDSGYYLVEI